MPLKFPVKFSPSLIPLWTCLQDWNPLFADIVFACDTFHSNLRKTDVFPLTPGAPKWNKEKRNTSITRYRLQQEGFYNPELLHT